MAMAMYIYLCICKNMDLGFVAGVEVKCFPFVHSSLYVEPTLRILHFASLVPLNFIESRAS
jgi:hypothetical protein